MSSDRKKVSRQALQLSRIDREFLVRELIESLYEGGEPPLDDGWYEFWVPELRQRMKDYEEGRTQALTWEEVKKGLEDLIASRNASTGNPRSVLDHPVFNVGEMLKPFGPDDDLLGEMLDLRDDKSEQRDTE
jgi:putative addiction module component (TIGR02574 family)